MGTIDGPSINRLSVDNDRHLTLRTFSRKGTKQTFLMEMTDAQKGPSIN